MALPAEELGILRSDLQLYSFDSACHTGGEMKISIIVPIGNMDEWKVCEQSIIRAITAYKGDVDAELLPCWDLEHKGAWTARNEGLDKATGDWIAWVDCDDVVELDWFREIANAIESHADADVIQFDAIEVKKGIERPLRYWKKGDVSGDAFSRELLRNDGMPAWLWTRVFRSELFDAKRFAGRVKQDYRMFLEILPRISHVWSIGKPLYRYIRHGHGLSNYVQCMDYGQAAEDFKKTIGTLPVVWRNDALVGLALTMADVAFHSNMDNGAKSVVRKLLLKVLADRRVPSRLKLKCILSAFGVKCR